jgi:tungstate transport system substrate-binding protein
MFIFAYITHMRPNHFVLRNLGFCLLIFYAVFAHAGETLRLASTTSTEATGFFKYMLPIFERQCACTVSVIAVGTGKALKLGENGDVDVVLVHSRADEDQFVAQGFGVDRRDVMYNDFVLVGPKGDPARVREAKSIGDVMKRIVDANQTFVSRGDDSGTHKKELQLWKAVGIQPQGMWYLSAGQGMSEVLMMTSERSAYTLSDRSTYTALAQKIELDILFSGDATLHNPYGVIAVNAALFPDANHALAKHFIEWITSKEGQQLIAGFKVNGQQLFFPSAKKN